MKKGKRKNGTKFLQICSIILIQGAFLAAKSILVIWDEISQKKENVAWVRNVSLPASWQTKIEKFDYDHLD